MHEKISWQQTSCKLKVKTVKNDATKNLHFESDDEWYTKFLHINAKIK